MFIRRQFSSAPLNTPIAIYLRYTPEDNSHLFFIARDQLAQELRGISLAYVDNELLAAIQDRKFPKELASFAITELNKAMQDSVYLDNRVGMLEFANISRLHGVDIMQVPTHVMQFLRITEQTAEEKVPSLLAMIRNNRERFFRQPQNTIKMIEYPPLIQALNKRHIQNQMFIQNVHSNPQQGSHGPVRRVDTPRPF